MIEYTYRHAGIRGLYAVFPLESRKMTYTQAFTFENTRRAKNGPWRIKLAGY